MSPESAKTTNCLRLGDGFELDVRAYQLRNAAIPLKMKPIQMELLLLLVERRGELVTREEIVERIWGKGVFLDTDNSINGAISRIRQVLCDDAEQPRFVQTITGKGYRFIAQVEEETPATGDRAIAIPAISPETSAEAVVAPSSQSGARVKRWSWLLGVSVLLVVAFVAYWQWVRSGARRQPATARVMLAVLPFENLTGDASQDYFSEGMTEELITELGRLNSAHLGVIARTSVTQYRRNPKPLDQVGRELGVQYVVEGSVRRDAGRVRVTAQLIQVKDQTHVWAARYDRDLKELLIVQSEIAGAISKEIQLALGKSSHNPPVEKPALSPEQYEAHDLYLRGRYFWNRRTPEGFREGADYFQQAVAKDPTYARGYAGLADTYGLMSTWNFGPQIELMPKARAAALRALEIDPTLAEAHTSLALIAEAYDYDWEAAEKEFRRAIELNPDYATAHQWYGEYLAWQGRFEEAFAESERARQLDPLSLSIANDHASIYYLARRYDRAIAAAHAVLDMDPNYAQALGLILSAYVQEGRFAEALEIVEHQPAGPWNWELKVFVYSRWGRMLEAQRALERFEQLAPKLGSWETWALVQAYANTEHKDEALALLEKGIAEHSFNPAGIKVDPAYDPLRSDARFQELLRRLRLAQ